MQSRECHSTRLCLELTGLFSFRKVWSINWSCTRYMCIAVCQLQIGPCRLCPRNFVSSCRHKCQSAKNTYCITQNLLFCKLQTFVKIFQQLIFNKTQFALTARASMDNILGLSCRIRKELSPRRYL